MDLVVPLRAQRVRDDCCVLNGKISTGISNILWTRGMGNLRDLFFACMKELEEDQHRLDSVFLGSCRD